MKFLFALIVVVLSVLALAKAGKPAACLQPHSFQDKNPCRMFNPSWSYNAAENKCVRFIYGGCGGNDNIFDTQKECEDLCKN